MNFEKQAMTNLYSAIYVAVLPEYRQSCIQILKRWMGDSVQLFAGSHHLDPTVRTGLDAHLYTRVNNRAVLRGRGLFQTGSIRLALAAESLIVDLNPRNMTAWLLILARRTLRRRTLVWGHLYPQDGPDSKTAKLRMLMRRITDGTVTYTYSNAEQARRDLPKTPVWTAPNSLYEASEIKVGREERDCILYVGRLERSKKCDLLIRAFARIRKTNGSPRRLVFVGHGGEEGALKALAQELEVEDSVSFLGRSYDVATLRNLYNQALVSVSPGYAGLSLTQSLGFGVPVIVSRDEKHSPEIELAETGGIIFFDTDSECDLADKLANANFDVVKSAAWSDHVRSKYSAEAMALGLSAALRNQEVSRHG